MKNLIDDINTQDLDIPAEKIHNYIKDSNLEPGDRLPVRQKLGKILGLGPRVLREGLAVLEHQGIIRTQSKAGTIVAKPTAEKLEAPFRWYLESSGYDLLEMIRARACMESAAAYEAAQQRTARDLLVILDALEQLENKRKQQENDLEEELQFHLAVLSATHNPVMITFQELIIINLQRTCQEASFENVLSQNTNVEHQEIYDAIKAKKASKAFRLMYSHILSPFKPGA